MKKWCDFICTFLLVGWFMIVIDHYIPIPQLFSTLGRFPLNVVICIRYYVLLYSFWSSYSNHQRQNHNYEFQIKSYAEEVLVVIVSTQYMLHYYFIVETHWRKVWRMHLLTNTCKVIPQSLLWYDLCIAIFLGTLYADCYFMTQALNDLVKAEFGV